MSTDATRQSSPEIVPAGPNEDVACSEPPTEESISTDQSTMTDKESPSERQSSTEGETSQEVDDRGRKIYTVGTLRYTMGGLVVLFIWMLWGDFCFTLMEAVFPRILPIKLKSIGASNMIIGLLVGTIPGAMNFMITPIVSFKSDRHRGRLGRRIPFLLWPTPFLALFLILLGYGDAIGEWVYGAISSTFPQVTNLTVTLVVIGVLMVCFQFFNMFVASIYYYLFNDVVPEQFLGRFMALFRVVGLAAGIIFNVFIFGKAETHMREIFLAAALLYFVSFMLMCWRVKEGEYPPPPAQEGPPGIITSLKTYFHECFSHSYYVYFFLGTALYTMGAASTLFTVFFAQDIGVSLDQFGKIAGYMGIPSMLLMYPMGWLSDKFHPLRIFLVAKVLLLITTVAAFFFVHDFTSYVVYALVGLPLSVAVVAASLPMYMAILPKERYGQFCSAQAMVNAFMLIVGNVLAGKYMDFMGDYRYVYMWSAPIYLISVVFLFQVYRGWQRYGGMKNYHPPLTDISAPTAVPSDKGLEEVAATAIDETQNTEK